MPAGKVCQTCLTPHQLMCYPLQGSAHTRVERGELMLRWFTIFLGLAVTVCCVAGCGGGNGNPGVGAFIDAGTFRALQDGDVWSYYLTWNHGANTYTARTATCEISTAGPDLIYTLTVNFGAPYSTQTFKFRFTQAGNGVLTIDGLQAIDQAAIADAAPVLTSPAGDAYDTDNLAGTTTFAARNLIIALTNSGAAEDLIAADGDTYRCYKYVGTVDEGGYTMNFTLWINPAIGSIVKLVYAYDEDLGDGPKLLTATLLLNGKTLN